MKFNVYAMRDLKSGFLTPTVDQNDAMAARNFASSIQRSEGVLFTHKSDFQLYRIGEFDTDLGVINPEDFPVLVADGKDV